MPNPSTLAAEQEAQYHDYVAKANDLRRPKGAREAYLRVARDLAEELGIDGPPPINGRSAQPAPLVELTLTLQQLREARNGLKTLTFTEVGCILHGLRRAIQHDTGASQTGAQQLLDRLLAAEPPLVDSLNTSLSMSRRTLAAIFNVGDELAQFSHAEWAAAKLVNGYYVVKDGDQPYRLTLEQYHEASNTTYE